MGKDRCIRWERPYASMGWGEDDDFPDRLVSVVRQGGWQTTAPPTSQEDIFADAAIAARVGRSLEKNPFNYLASVYRRSTWTGWHYNVVRIEGSEDAGWRKRGVRGGQPCEPSVSTVRSCKRNLDRDLVRSPPRLRIGLRTYTDTIAPTGSWECTEYDDE